VVAVGILALLIFGCVKCCKQRRINKAEEIALAELQARPVEPHYSPAQARDKPVIVALPDLGPIIESPDDPAPPKPVLPPAANEREYKDYMIQRYQYEEWENRQLLKMKKLKNGDS